MNKRRHFANADVDFEPSLAAVRPDSVVKTEKAIYIVEFKYAKSADAALVQCREKRYADAYATAGFASPDVWPSIT